MSESELTFKIRPGPRYLGAGSGLLVMLMPLSILAFFPLARSLSITFVMDALRDRLLFILLIVIMMLGLGLYITLSWLMYAVELNDRGIARRGIPNLADRRIFIEYADIRRVTRGTKNVLKVIPVTGRPLATNIGQLEGGPSNLIRELRRRVPVGIVDDGLTSAIRRQQEEDRFSWLVPIVIILMAGLAYGSFTIAGWVLAHVAWEAVYALGEDSEPLASAADSEGAIWVLSERDGIDSADMSRFINGELQETIRSEDHPILQGAIDELGGASYIQSLLVDDLDQLWLLFRAGGELYKWDGTEWTHELPIFKGKQYQPDEIQLGTGKVWGTRLETGAIMSIDPASGEVDGLTLNMDVEEGRVVELAPKFLASMPDGGLLISGPINFGGDGILQFDAEQTVTLFTSVINQPVDPSWQLRMASGDIDGNIHVLYTNRDACEDGERLIRLGTRFQSSQWLWNELVFEDDCVGPYQESFIIDLKGRLWAQSGSTGVYVFASPAAKQANSAMQPIASYSTSNSGYNGMPIELVGDQVLAVNPFEGNAVGIDASNPELPHPVPRLFEPLFIAPFLIAFLLLPVLFGIIWIHQRPNRTR